MVCIMQANLTIVQEKSRWENSHFMHLQTGLQGIAPSAQEKILHWWEKVDSFLLTEKTRAWLSSLNRRPNKPGGGNDSIECIGSIEMEKGLMYALCTHYF
jgi:hypothetical protein